MGALGPGAWREMYGDPRTQSPDEIKRQRSGFWTCEYRIENDETVWRCDLRKLDEAVRRIMLDRQFSMQFAQDPKRFLDHHFGEGTGYCYSHSRKDMDRPYMDYRFPRWMDRERGKYYRGYDLARDDKADAMAYWNSGTSTNTTTSTAGSSFFTMTNNTFIKDHLDREVKKSVKEASKTFRWKAKKITPALIEPKKRGMVKALQQAFDSCYRDQMALLHG